MVALIASGSLNEKLADRHLEEVARELAWDLRTAREEAILAEEVQIVSFYPNSNFYKRNDGTTVKLDEQVSYAVSFTEKRCCFAPSGAPAGGGTIAIKNKQNTIMYVIVNPVAGRVRISSEPPADW